ncbi:hypothetical protein MAR_002197 [Mya arenaria]|uniref:Uncharacterized protein n=1 Tax=Mya arenaria TaxID=6604 RepID=A0ABY7FHK7_MYAAR|nr:hypothetical protein MAR_002197 [Mya arenaria]
MKDHFDKEIKITKQQEKDFKKATSCHICKKTNKESNYENDKHRPVRDHCYAIGLYRLSAHNKTCIEYYKLDPSDCFSSPNFAWNACLKTTKCATSFDFDINMHLMIEK